MTVLPHFHRNCYHCRRFSRSRIIVGLNKISPMYACKNGGYGPSDKSLRQMECLPEFLLSYPQINKKIKLNISLNISYLLNISSNISFLKKRPPKNNRLSPMFFLDRRRIFYPSLLLTLFIKNIVAPEHSLQQRLPKLLPLQGFWHILP